MSTSPEKNPLEVPEEVVLWAERLHGVVDELVAPIVAAHGARLRCRSGCNDCCSDGLTVFPLEAAVIARHHGELLATGTPHAEGACAFLDEEGACRIYAQRPYVCRTQGLPLRWLEHDDEGPAEVRDICPKNVAPGPALEELGADECWTLGPFEERLAKHGDGTRVALRSLFTGGPRRLPVLR
jgi:hypothetical protein